VRLIIDFEEKYKNLFYEVIKATDSTIVHKEFDFDTELPEYVKAGIEKGLEQAKNGQTKSYEEVKKILANRKWHY
jgi:hypothetical protein